MRNSDCLYIVHCTVLSVSPDKHDSFNFIGLALRQLIALFATTDNQITIDFIKGIKVLRSVHYVLVLKSKLMYLN